MTEEAVKVFISYSWDSDEHKERVLALSDSLRKHGIDCQIDRYHQSPSEGWYRWMMEQIEESDFVLVVCTEKYKLRFQNKEEQGQGRGVTWEGGQIIAELYSGQGINDKYIPVLLSPEAERHIPRSLQTYTVYRLLNRDTYDLNKPGDYQNLYRHLTKQPAYVPAQLGKPQILPPISGASSTVGDYGEIVQDEDPTILKEQEQEQIRLEQRQVGEQERLYRFNQSRQQQAVEVEPKQEKLEQQGQEKLEQEVEGTQQQERAKQPLPDAPKGDYAYLEGLLKEGKWKQADRETAKQMYTVMGRQREGLLRVEDIEQFPYADLRIIDQLWTKYSKDKFGFSIQKKIWQRCGSAEHDKQWKRFGEEVGWKRKGVMGVNNDWRNYSELTFDLFDADEGHLPSSRLFGSFLKASSSNSKLWGYIALLSRNDL